MQKEKHDWTDHETILYRIDFDLIFKTLKNLTLKYLQHNGHKAQYLKILQASCPAKRKELCREIPAPESEIRRAHHQPRMNENAREKCYFLASFMTFQRNRKCGVIVELQPKRYVNSGDTIGQNLVTCAISFSSLTVMSSLDQFGPDRKEAQAS